MFLYYIIYIYIYIYNRASIFTSRLASCRLTSLRLASLRFAWPRFASLRFASLRSASLRLASLRFASPRRCPPSVIPNRSQMESCDHSESGHSGLPNRSKCLDRPKNECTRSWVSQPRQKVMGFPAQSTNHGFLSPVNKSWVSQPRQQVMGLSAPGHGFSISFFLLGAGRPCRYDRILFLFAWAHRC